MTTSFDGNERSNPAICPHCGRPLSASRSPGLRPLPPVEPLRAYAAKVTQLRARR